MIAATGIELRAGSRLLLDGATFRIAAGDRVGLVGRNGAGKTTLTKVLAGEGQPAAGTVTSTGEVGYLPAGPAHRRPRRAGPRPHPVGPRPGRRSSRELREAEGAMASADDETRDKAMRRYGRLEAEFTARGGYAAESEAASIASSLSACRSGSSASRCGTLSGGQRRRVELARILFSGAQTLLLDEPTNHLDADSIVWLREFLKAYKGGLVVISHDVELLDAVVNRVFHLDANRAELDVYNVGWKAYLQQRETDERAPQARARQRREEGRGR